jgi:hypothetical protein
MGIIGSGIGDNIDAGGRPSILGQPIQAITGRLEEPGLRRLEEQEEGARGND